MSRTIGDRIVHLFSHAFLASIKNWQVGLRVLAEMVDTGKERIKAERIYKCVYFVLAASLVLAVMLSFPGIRILASLGVQVPIDLDRIVTGLLFLGGAERLSQFLQQGSAGEKSEATSPPPPPIAIEGTLMLIGSPEQANQMRITRDQGLPSR